VGSTNNNIGNIYLFPTTAGGATIPTNNIMKVIPAGWNMDNYAHHFIPCDLSNNWVHFDYSNIGFSSSSSASDDYIRFEIKQSTSITSDPISRRLQSFYVRQGNTDIGISFNLSDLTMNLKPTVSTGLDLLITYNHSNGSDAFFSSAIGFHYSSSNN